MKPARLFLLLGLLVMALRYYRIRTQAELRWKEDSDRLLWEAGRGPAHVRRWIVTFNRISNDVAGRGGVVTSWHRDDGTAHADLSAVDFRRLSAANEYDPDPYTRADVVQIETRAVAEGIPVYVVAEGTPGEHWHLGPITVG